MIKGTLSQLISYYEEKSPRGEYVLIVEGKKRDEDKEEITLEGAAEMAAELVIKGKKPSEACKEIAAKTPFSKSEIYKVYLEINQ